MAAVVQAAHAISWPGHDVWHPGQHLLLTAGTEERPGRAGTGDPADEPFAVAVRLPTLHPADSPTQIEPGALTASTMGAGHPPSLSERPTRTRMAHDEREATSGSETPDAQPRSGTAKP